MKRMRSDVTKQGLDRTPHRAFMRAMGLDDDAIARPMVGIVSMKGEQTPCNMTHAFQVWKRPAARRASSPPSPSPTASV